MTVSKSLGFSGSAVLNQGPTGKMMNLCGLVSGDNDFRTRVTQKKKKILLWDEALRSGGGLETFFLFYISLQNPCKLCILIHSLCCLWHKSGFFTS